MRWWIVLAVLSLGLLPWAWSEAGARARAPRPEIVRAPTITPSELETTAPEEPLEEPAVDYKTELGDCSLELAMVDAETGKALAGKLRLFRVKLPDADALRGTFEVPVTGMRFESLPAGWYRVDVAQERAAGPADVAFEVDGTLTRRTIRVHLPREFRFEFTVTDPQGRAVTDGALLVDEFRGRWWTEPDWFEYGTEEDEVECEEDDAFALTMWGGSWTDEEEFAESGTEVFELGMIKESVRCVTSCPDFSWSRKDWSTIEYRFWEVRAGPHHGIAVPLALIEEAIRLPDGELAKSKGAIVKAHSYAVCGTFEDARKESIRVRVQLEGFKPLHFEFLPGERIPQKTMEPKEAP